MERSRRARTHRWHTQGETDDRQPNRRPAFRPADPLRSPQRDQAWKRQSIAGQKRVPRTLTRIVSGSHWVPHSVVRKVPRLVVRIRFLVKFLVRFLAELVAELLA